jgi:hypothetical protein
MKARGACGGVTFGGAHGAKRRVQGTPYWNTGPCPGQLVAGQRGVHVLQQGAAMSGDLSRPQPNRLKTAHRHVSKTETSNCKDIHRRLAACTARNLRCAPARWSQDHRHHNVLDKLVLAIGILGMHK